MLYNVESFELLLNNSNHEGKKGTLTLYIHLGDLVHWPRSSERFQTWVDHFLRISLCGAEKHNRMCFLNVDSV